MRTLLETKSSTWQSDSSEYDLLTRVHKWTPESPTLERWEDAWFSLVENYSARQLTKEQDKLPALSGLSRSIATRTGDTYCAGLWRSHIIFGMYWELDSFEPTHFGDDPEHDAKLPPPSKSAVKFRTEYRAPSWSWASLDARVKFPSPLQHGSMCAECIDVQIEPAAIHPFGKVKSGSIKLRVSC